MKYILLFFLLSCASKPYLYPNKKYNQNSKEQRERDINYCLSKAEESLQGRNTTGKAIGKGAIIGGAMGIVTGILSGQNIVERAARSATAGAVVGGTVDAISPDELKRRYVNKCLLNKGYEVIGWD